MASEDQDKSPLGLPGLIVMLLGALGSYYLFRPPMHTARPSAVQEQRAAPVGEQQVEARLWQDPFAAVREYEQLKGGHGEEAQAELSSQLCVLRASIHERVKNGQKLLVLPVTADDGPYAENREDRLRCRYAVMSALGRSHYAPADREHIAFVRLAWQGDDKLGKSPENVSNWCWKSDGERHLDVPYEWFERDKQASGENENKPWGDHVLVLWLDDSRMSRFPLTRLAQVLEALGIDSPRQRDNLRVRLLGPSSSDGLKAMYDDDILPYIDAPWWPNLKISGNFYRDLRLRCLGERLNGLQIYSYRATAEDALFQENQTTTKSCTPRLCKVKEPESYVNIWKLTTCDPCPDKDIFDTSKTPVWLCRIGGTDEDLCRELVEELKLRDVDLNEDRVALVGEWDTQYGRQFKQTFKKTVARQRGTAGNVEFFSYMKGLDGDEAKTTEKSKGGEETAVVSHHRMATEQRFAVGETEQPDGTAQFDYMGRLAAEIKDRDPRPVAAVGVVGSDIYDKLLVLRALRDEFREAVFFTTDLDNRLMYKAELGWTRNLVVASNFGQRIEPYWQGTIPPFRDNYQTSLYTACLTATDRMPIQVATQVAPRRFEIGLNGAVDLSIEPTAPASWLLYRPLHPRRQLPGEAWETFWAMRGPVQLTIWIPLAMGMLAGLTMTFSQTARRIILGRIPAVPGVQGVIRRTRFWKFLLAWFIISTAFIFLFIWILFALLGNPKEEPMAWVSGVSVWPSVMIRLMVVLLGIFWFLNASQLLRNNADYLAREYFLPPAPSPRLTWWLLMRWVIWLLAGVAMGMIGIVLWSIPILILLFYPLVLVALDFFVLRPLANWRWACSLPERMSISAWESSTPTSWLVTCEWKRYQTMGRWFYRLPRVFAVSLAYLTVGCTAISINGFPHTLARGSVSKWVDLRVLAASVVVLVALTVYVSDAVRLCYVFSKRIGSSTTKWSWTTLQAKGNALGMDPHDVGYLLDMRLINERAQAISSIVPYPFILLLMMILARNSLFDHWTWPLPLVLIFTVNSLWTILCIGMLQRTVTGIQERVTSEIRDKIACLITAAVPAQQRVQRLEKALKEIEEMKEGVFARWFAGPAIGAALLPTGGLIAIKVIEYLIG